MQEQQTVSIYNKGAYLVTATMLLSAAVMNRVSNTMAIGVKEQGYVYLSMLIVSVVLIVVVAACVLCKKVSNVIALFCIVSYILVGGYSYFGWWVSR